MDKQTRQTFDELAKNINQYLEQKGFFVLRNSYEEGEYTIRYKRGSGEKSIETDITITISENGDQGWFSFG